MGCGCKDAQQEPIVANNPGPTNVTIDMPSKNVPAATEADIWKKSFEELQKKYEDATRKFDDVVSSLPEDTQNDIVRKFFSETDTAPKQEHKYKVFRFEVELRYQEHEDVDLCTMMDSIEVKFAQTGYGLFGYSISPISMEDSTKEYVALSNPNYKDDELF
jgi:hypothetical protein